MDGVEQFDKIIKDFEAVVNKLEGWYDYYKEEDLFVPLSPNMDNIGDTIGNHVKSLRRDIMLLKIGCDVLRVQELVKANRH